MHKSQLSVLLIEDSLPEVELNKEVFADSPISKYAIHSASRLSQALDLLKTQPIDIIILDLGLPDSKGLPTLETLMPVAETIPIIVLTGNDDQILGQQAIRRGAQDFLAKGYGTEMMLPRICFYTIERHRLQRKALEAESFLRSTIDSLPAHIAITDSTGRIILVNTAWRQFFRETGLLPAETNEGASFFQACVSGSGAKNELLQELTPKTDQLMAGEISSFAMEYSCQRGEELRWFRLEVSPFTGLGAGRLVVVRNDISERKEMEQSLKKNEEFLRCIFDTSPNLIFVKDDQGRYIMANEALAQAYGCAADEMIGNTDWDIMREQQLETTEADYFQKIDHEVLASKTTRYIEEEPLTDIRGIKRWYRTTKTPICFPGLPPYLLGIASDISTERRDKQRIRNSELLLSTILDTMHHSILLLDPDMRVIWANKTAQDVAGKQPEEIVGSSCCAIWYEAKVCDACPARTALQTGTITIESFQISRTKTLRITGNPVYNEKGALTSVLCMVEDVSERASLEQQLRQAQKMEALGTLAGGIAHDFNNILTAILGFTQLALTHVTPEEKLEHYLQEVYQASIRARDLVQQILTFSRRLDQELKPLDIALVMKEALKLLRSTLPTTIQLQAKVYAGLGLVMADPTQIHQIMMNLCTNAAHAMKEQGGTLAVNLEQRLLGNDDLLLHPTLKPGPYLELTVSDTGHGIPQEVLPSIFEPYFTTKELGEGTGLGLAVVHGIVRDYGGDIQVTSIPEQQTIFSILLPTQQPASGPLQNGRQVAPPPRGHGESILVLDDEPAVLRLCQQVLEEAGYQVTTIGDVRAAKHLLLNSPDAFDLLLTDMTMPYMTGEALVQELFAVLPQLPVIIMSGHMNQFPASHQLKEKVHFLTKPLDQPKLLEKINALLHP